MYGECSLIVTVTVSMEHNVTLIHLKVCMLVCNLVILDCRCNKNILIDSVFSTNSHSDILSHRWSWTGARTRASSAQSRETRCENTRESSPCLLTPGSWPGISGSGPCFSSCRSRPCSDRSCSLRLWSSPAQSRPTCAGSGRAQSSSRSRPPSRSRNSCRGSWWSGRWWPPGQGGSAPGISPHTSPREEQCVIKSTMPAPMLCPTKYISFLVGEPETSSNSFMGEGELSTSFKIPRLYQVWQQINSCQNRFTGKRELSN